MRKAGGLIDRPSRFPGQLLPFVTFDHFVDFSLDLIEVEARWCLHRREIDRRFCELRYRLLHRDEAPELSAVEIIHVAAAEIVHGLTPNRRRSLERILTDVDDPWHVRVQLLSRPTA